MKKKVLFFYSELAAYFLECALHLKSIGFEVHIVHLPVNSDAPFNFSDRYNSLRFYDREKFTLRSLYEFSRNINPDIILCSGWRDKIFLDVCKIYFNKIPTVLLFDNKWEGTIKQKLASYLSPFKLLNRFSHAWVPGVSQFTFAEKLGFNKDKVYTGFYCADLNLFSNYYLQRRELNTLPISKKMLYIGRYSEVKGLPELWSEFSSIVDEFNLDWELICVGTGDLKPFEHARIKHVGFVQPQDLSAYIFDASLFILPSLIEPWGVIVHEMAAAGLPLILSDKVGAGEVFLVPGENGWLFSSGSQNSLRRVLLASMNTDSSILKEMGDRSHAISSKINHQQWVNVVRSLLDN